MKKFTAGMIAGIFLYFAASSLLLKCTHKIIVDDPIVKVQGLTPFEKEYPVHDNYGNYFKEMPKVYSHKYLTKGLSKYGNYTTAGLSTTFSPLWAEGKPTGFLEIEEHSYSPFYEDTAIVYNKVDYIYTKNIGKWKVKSHEWVQFEPVRWGDSLAPITQVTTFAHYRLVPLIPAIISLANSTQIYTGAHRNDPIVTTSPKGLPEIIYP